MSIIDDGFDSWVDRLFSTAEGRAALEFARTEFAQLEAKYGARVMTREDLVRFAEMTAAGLLQTSFAKACDLVDTCHPRVLGTQAEIEIKHVRFLLMEGSAPVTWIQAREPTRVQVNAWLYDIHCQSSIHAMQRHSLFPELVKDANVGRHVVLRLFDGEHHVGFFVLLAVITGATPVPPEDAGVVSKMTQHWIRWWIQNA